jgi:hypothetical protein
MAKPIDEECDGVLHLAVAVDLADNRLAARGEVDSIVVLFRELVLLQEGDRLVDQGAL